jgi:hypothetical protein
MKMQAINLNKNDAVIIAHRALVETIANRPGIWTYLNRRVRLDRKAPQAAPERRAKRATLCSA